MIATITDEYRDMKRAEFILNDLSYIFFASDFKSISVVDASLK